MIRQLVAALAEAGVETDAEAIADALWLVRARRDEPENGDHQHAPAIRSAPTEPRPPDAEPQHPADSDQAVRERGSGRGPDGSARASQAATGPGAAASSITLQRARALPGALELGRALRPLKQRHSSKRNHVLDAEATVEYFCDTGVLTPVMRPGAERWFDVDVLIDAGPSMAVWQETAMELVSLLERHGAFREVRHWTLDQVEGKVRLSRAAGVRSEAPQLVDPGARRLTMVVTDCIGPMWYQAQIWDAIRGWGLFSPVVIVTMLPSRLWPRTALGSSEVIMRSHQPGTANRSLDAALPWWWPNDDPSQPSVPVPVITLEAGPVAAWARVVMGAGGVEVPGVLAKPPPGKTAARSGHAPPDAEERVQRFRVTMSPIAYRLAVYLAAALHGRWDLALARLVQEAMLPDSSQVHLAEVIVGGLVRQAKRHTRHEEPMFEFVDGVPHVLQRSLTGTEALQVLQALGGHIERETGHSPGIAAMLLGETAPAIAAEQFEDVRIGAANLIQTIGLAPGSTEIDQRTGEDGDRVTPDPLVLIVDDLAPNVRLLDAVLSPKGFRVATASSGAEALDVLGREHPDLVLLDIVMPGMDGYEVCRRIREDPATAFLPVIMIAEGGAEEKVRAIEAGADDFVSKPFGQAELLARVRSLVRVKRYLDTIEQQAAELARCKRELERQGGALESSEFLASVSHELRTPLNAIIDFSDVLLERMFGELNERQDDYLRDIWSSGKHLRELLNDILDLSKSNAGQTVLNRSEFDVRESLEYCLSIVRERALKQRILLSLEVDPEVGLLDADRLRFRQVVLNLLSNAVKFTPEGGHVDVRASIQGQDLIVTVTDTGVGVPAEDRERIFDSFQQGTPQAEGTGLGLTLSKRIIELHEGRIWVESEVERGSTFGFALPTGSKVQR